MVLVIVRVVHIVYMVILRVVVIEIEVMIMQGRVWYRQIEMLLRLKIGLTVIPSREKLMLRHLTLLL